jgi:hypothetical protein
MADMVKEERVAIEAGTRSYTHLLSQFDVAMFHPVIAALKLVAHSTLKYLMLRTASHLATPCSRG